MTTNVPTCRWEAWGDYTCVAPPPPAAKDAREGFYWGDPATDPDCAKYGCAEGRTCATSSDCANGLSCIDTKCARTNPHSTENRKRVAKNDEERDREEDEERERAMAELRRTVLAGQKRDKQDNLDLDASATDGSNSNPAGDSSNHQDDEGDKSWWKTLVNMLVE
jgi:hypothetical protein